MTTDLSVYGDHFDAALISYVQAKLADGSVREIDPDLIPAALGFAISKSQATEFLERLSKDKIVAAIDHKHCANEACEQPITEVEIGKRTCSTCDGHFADHGEPFIWRRYLVKTNPSRDIRWMIVVHGFNTRGPWQEKFSWLIANKLKYGAPVLIYKYGFERLGVLFRFRHNQLVQRLGTEIRAAMEIAKQSQNNQLPDVVIHSFGSLIFSKVLISDDFQDLKFGRIICVGSVINPKFDWSSVVGSGRVDAVLCHCGQKDNAVPLAQLTIPDSGPAGRVGFCDPVAINISNDEFAHSSALLPENLETQLQDRGSWDRFLTDPEGQFDDPSAFREPDWVPASALARGLIWTQVILLIGSLPIIGWKLLALFFG